MCSVMVIKLQLRVMKFRLVFVAGVLSLNIYYFIVWLVAFKKFTTQGEKVSYFLEKSLLFNTVTTLNICMLTLTIMSLVILNAGNMKSYLARIGISLVHIFFILYIFWGML